MKSRDVGAGSRPFGTRASAMARAIAPMERLVAVANQIAPALAEGALRLGAVTGAIHVAGESMASVDASAHRLATNMAEAVARAKDLSIRRMRADGPAATGRGVHSESGLFGPRAGEEGADRGSGPGRVAGGEYSALRLKRAAQRLLAIAPMAAAGEARPARGAGMMPPATAARNRTAGETLALGLAHGLGRLNLSAPKTAGHKHHHERLQALARQSTIGAIARGQEADRGARSAPRIAGPTGEGIKPFGSIAAPGYAVHGERGTTPRSSIGEMTPHGPEVRRPGNAGLAQGRARISEALKSGVATFAGTTAQVGGLKDLGIDEATGRMKVLDKAARLSLSKSLADTRGSGARFARSDRAVRPQPASGTAWEAGAARPVFEGQHLALLKRPIAPTLRSVDDRLKFAETDRQERRSAPAFFPVAGRARPTEPLAGLDTLRSVPDGAAPAPGLNFANRRTIAEAGATVAASPIGGSGGRSQGAAGLPQGTRAGSAGAAMIHIEAPLTVTVQGDMVGDAASLNMLLGRLADEHARTITDAVIRRLRDRQDTARRSAMLDWGNADVHLGGAGSAL
ncbi:MAG TPA: hypothetical protein VMF62_17385 [Acetobacteraceae bacterium]|nr:hypothetical protein [Acetobacteraceae bacterium]